MKKSIILFLAIQSLTVITAHATHSLPLTIIAWHIINNNPHREVFSEKENYHIHGKQAPFIKPKNQKLRYNKKNSKIQQPASKRKAHR